MSVLQVICTPCSLPSCMLINSVTKFSKPNSPHHSHVYQSQTTVTAPDVHCCWTKLTLLFLLRDIFSHLPAGAWVTTEVNASALIWRYSVVLSYLGACWYGLGDLNWGWLVVQVPGHSCWQFTTALALAAVSPWSDSLLQPHMDHCLCLAINTNGWVGI